MAKQKPIMIKKKNQGKFTDWAKKNMPGKSVCAAASAVMKNEKNIQLELLRWQILQRTLVVLNK